MSSLSYESAILVSRKKIHRGLYLALFCFFTLLILFFFLSYLLSDRFSFFRWVRMLPRSIIYSAFSQEGLKGLFLLSLGTFIFSLSAIFFIYKAVRGYWRVILSPSDLILIALYGYLYYLLLSGKLGLKERRILSNPYGEMMYYIVLSPIYFASRFIGISEGAVNFFSYILWPWYTFFVSIFLNYAYIGLFFESMAMRHLRISKELYEEIDDSVYKALDRRGLLKRLFFPLKKRIYLSEYRSYYGLALYPYLCSVMRVSSRFFEYFENGYKDEFKAALGHSLILMENGEELSHILYISLIWPIELFVYLFLDMRIPIRGWRILYRVLSFPFFLASVILKCVFIYTEAFLSRNLMVYKGDLDSIKNGESLSLIKYLILSSKENASSYYPGLSNLKRLYKMIDLTLPSFDPKDIGDIKLSLDLISHQRLSMRDRKWLLRTKNAVEKSPMNLSI